MIMELCNYLLQRVKFLKEAFFAQTCADFIQGDTWNL
jgi:hypothetical protein